MKLLILLDKAGVSQKPRISQALDTIKSDYKGVTPVTWVYKETDFSSLEWEEYLPGFLGINRGYINSSTKEIWGKNKYDYDHVIYCVDPSNWKAPGIGGWNLGTQFHNYYPQIVKISNSDKWLPRIFAMEIAHAIDEVAKFELGVSLDRLKGMDFDNEIIHGEDSRYGIPDSESHTGYFTDYNYRPVILEFAEYIKKGYAKREEKRIERQTKMMSIISLLGRIVAMLQAKQPTPFLFHPHSH